MSFADRRATVIDEIAASCHRHGRDPASVELLAVSKTRPAETVRDAFAHGQLTFGENRVQELIAKAAEVEEPVRWHLIGSLQTNKINQVLRIQNLELFHSLDRAKLASALEQRLAETGRELDALLQIEATGEASKHGVTPEAAPELADRIAADCPHVRLRGLMAIGPRTGEAAPVFERVAALRDSLATRIGVDLPVLSLGMSGDLDAAVAAGSTLVRVGTALFGPRG